MIVLFAWPLAVTPTVASPVVMITVRGAIVAFVGACTFASTIAAPMPTAPTAMVTTNASEVTSEKASMSTVPVRLKVLRATEAVTVRSGSASATTALIPTTPPPTPIAFVSTWSLPCAMTVRPPPLTGPASVPIDAVVVPVVIGRARARPMPTTPTPPPIAKTPTSRSVHA